MKRVGAILFAVILCAMPIFADQPDPVGVVAHVLELSEDQIMAWSKILHAREEAIQPLAEQAQAQQQTIGQSLASGNPDPQAIGRAVIQLNALQKQIGGVNVQSAEQFEQLLTPDQLERLNGIRGAAQVCPIVPAFQATGLLGY